MPEVADEAYVESIYAVVIDGHVFLPRPRRKSGPVWIGYKEHINALDPDQVLTLIRYRIEMDRRCCGRVH